MHISLNTFSLLSISFTNLTRVYLFVNRIRFTSSLGILVIIVNKYKTRLQIGNCIQSFNGDRNASFAGSQLEKNQINGDGRLLLPSELGKRAYNQIQLFIL